MATSEEIEKYCRNCVSRDFVNGKGLVCKRTGELPAFEEECDSFEQYKELERLAPPKPEDFPVFMTEEEMLAEENLPKGILCAVVACIVGAVAWYIAPQYLASLGTEDCDLEECFRQAQDSFRYVYRDEGGSRVRQLFETLARTVRQGGYGAALLERAQFLELMVEVNRVCRGGHQVQAASGDSKVVALLQYLNLHLTEELTIDQLSERFYVSKYHMMRRFRRETGYSIHGYVTEKRLLLAQRLLAQGASPSEVGAQVGYQDYSTFSRAYKKQFGRGPSADVVHESTICMELGKNCDLQ